MKTLNVFWGLEWGSRRKQRRCPLTAGKLINTGQTLAEWVSDPESFRNELNQAYTDIAERIVKEVFLGTESN